MTEKITPIKRSRADASEARTALRSWATDDAAQAKLTAVLAEALGDVRERLIDLAHEVGGDGSDGKGIAPLLAVAMHQALRDASDDALAWSAALARTEGWPLSLISEATGREATSNPRRDLPSFDALVEADLEARGGSTPAPVDGKRLRIVLDRYEFLPTDDQADYDEQDYGLKPAPSEEIPKPTRDLRALEAEFAEARRSAKRSEKA